ncbi:RHS repeat-associated core domain-containing protein [Chryseobacterium soldanellicola]|uniref:RHS repeat-associated core domain-containing protein n=1 Tax=Chryseobacterium soldanellicola TaxID=311333 RepID=A0A1H1CKK7_9FLAO|nr:DUF6443 domain-containing protein [Chryseobacterium soldanellicola]SDQ64609.1 RHS repeat-associated core domain-containing protein [Chryseobacterium soldanellicola]
MKKIIIPIIISLLASGIMNAQTSTNENYVQSTTYLDYPSSGSPKTAVSVQYLDGLARPKQTINIKASPQANDVVSHVEYDAFGRQVKEYLPAPQHGTLNGAIYTNPLSYPTTNPNIYGPEKIYTEKILESSPLDRVLEQRQVGNAWNDKPMTMEYGTNVSGDVNKYVVVTSWASGATSSAINLSGTYGTGLLYSTTVTDEDGNKTIEFKNSQGQVILVRKALNATQNADTYYVYNEYDQLAFVIPPLAATASNVNSVLDTLCYAYKYDDRNRMVAKKLPGKSWEYVVYDKQDRIVLSQDAELGKNNQWQFTKYDSFGRVAYTGIYTSTVAYGMEGRQTEQNNVNALGSNNETRGGSSPDSSVTSLNYSNTAYPTASIKIFTISYYDSFPRDPWFPSDLPGTILNQNVILNTQTGSAKGLLLASYIKNIESDDWTRSFMLYDTKGRLIGTRETNHLGGYTKTDTELNFTGLPNQTITKHKRLIGDTERMITETFTYDHQNRPLTHKHKIDSNPEEYLSQNEYNELSQLSSKKVGGTNPAQPLQTVDYKYNIRGWMTKINDPVNLNGKLFGYEVKYTNPVYSSLASGKFNGNIAEIDWKTSNDGVLRRYDYQYDLFNRLQKGLYSEPGSSVPQNNFFNEELIYDINGNITNLKRNSKSLSGSAELIDNLNYNYTGNRLTSVNETQLNYRGYPDVSGNTIAYDDNGNMKDQKDKGILQIRYNHLNLPNYLEFDRQYFTRNQWQNENVYNFYRADGVKFRKEHRYSENSVYKKKTTEYLDGFQYEIIATSGDPTIKFVPTSEGYFNFENNKYIYNYVDHLGNVRVSYFNNGSSAEVLEENNYYPFGLKHEGYNALAGNPTYNYKYNGKELQQESGMYDYGARFYMPDIGRWGKVDPLAETSRRWSPYTYAFNNPIRFIDPDGMQNKDITFGKSVSVDTQNKIVGDLEKETGLTLSVGDDGKLSYKESADAGGSKTARDMLKGAIDNHRTDYQVNSDNTKSTSIDTVGSRGETIDGVYGATITYDLNINTNQIDKFVAGTSEALNPLTMGYGMSTLHEISHKYNNLEDQNIIYGSAGPNEKVINTIRRELDASGQFNLPFGQRNSYSPIDVLYKGKVHNFTPFERAPAVMDGNFNKINVKKNLFMLTPKTK